MNYLLVFIGGGIGSLLRFGIGKFSSRWSFDFPLATLISNLSACIIFTLILYFWTRDVKTDWVYPFAIIGLCGGFSTFSTFAPAKLLDFTLSAFLAPLAPLDPPP